MCKLRGDRKQIQMQVLERLLQLKGVPCCRQDYKQEEVRIQARNAGRGGEKWEGKRFFSAIGPSARYRVKGV